MTPLSAPSDPATDAFLYLVDALDAEANAVTHAVVRAQATVRSIVDDARILLDTPQVEERAWAEVGVRLMQHRAVLVDALATLCRAGSETTAGGHGSVMAISTPLPPRSVSMLDGPPKASDPATPEPSPVAQDRSPVGVPPVPTPPQAHDRRHGGNGVAPAWAGNEEAIPRPDIAVPAPPRARHRPPSPRPA